MMSDKRMDDAYLAVLRADHKPFTTYDGCA